MIMIVLPSVFTKVDNHAENNKKTRSLPNQNKIELNDPLLIMQYKLCIYANANIDLSY